MAERELPKLRTWVRFNRALAGRVGLGFQWVHVGQQNAMTIETTRVA
jgi:hypothetical protein